ncbi:phosphonate C-P lyase system protein PhnG [Actinopolymorpha pittospori]|uniref:Alpha-D-ribose 1-methylphosphonate 5-triphosphate synthase subunit PhnG n=1 Tax=Actinopolymorpha pittospori TaxID=648752 RepID=A0A927MUS3_9ACTN|nr:alpha-D-ribose 1-methylphosphonate 5-triphosphate synthase subunit PhnG [Actinopolymorpha pittospori]
MTGTATEDTLSREERASLLARALPEELEPLAEETLARKGDPVVLSGPEVGMVMMQVREPVAAERFYLGEVLVTRTEVELGGHRGWCMRLGDDRQAALAAAILDAAAEAPDGADRASVEALCRRVAEREARAARAEWAEIAPTEVRFEELDS